MVPHQLRRFRWLVGFDGVDQRMVGMALAGRFTLFPVERDDEGGVGDEVVHEVRENAVVGDLRDADVELCGQHDGCDLTAEALVIQRGRNQPVSDVTVRGDAGRLVAMGMVTSRTFRGTAPGGASAR
jgi:hypothetical protein